MASGASFCWLSAAQMQQGMQLLCALKKFVYQLNMLLAHYMTAAAAAAAERWADGSMARWVDGSMGSVVGLKEMFMHRHFP